MLQRIRLQQVRSNATNNTYNTFADQLKGMMLPTVDVQYGVVGKQTYTLKQNMLYTVGKNQLKVSLNGVDLNILDGDFTEIDEQNVQMNFDIQDGDIFVFRVEGSGGGAVTSDHVHYENVTLTGAINGINKTFSLPAIPRKKLDLTLFVDGVVQKQSSFSLTANQVTLGEAPLSGMVLTANFIV